MKKELSFLDRPKNVRRLLFLFYVVLIGLLAIDPFISKHSEFPWENMPAFFAVYGFVSCVALIFVAKLLRIFLIRDENYYL